MHIDSESISATIDMLRQSFATNITKPLYWRKEQLCALEKMLKDHEQALQNALFADLHKSKFESYVAEIAQINAEINYFKKNLKKLAQPTQVKTPLTLQPGESFIIPEPLGVVCIIGPWNYPISLMLQPLAAAIASGNCALLKPSEMAPNCAQLLGDLLPQYLDPKAFCVINGGANTVEELLMNRFDHIFYTGSARFARNILQMAAQFLTPVTLELGGKSPCIVDKEVDLRTAAKRIAWGKWSNAGQTCVAPDYVLVQSSIKGALINELKRALRKMYGENPDKSPDYGRIINEQHQSRLISLLAGQHIVHGGDCNLQSLYFSPTIVDECDENSPLMQEEIFGPILPIFEFDSMQEAVAKISTQAKPLALYLFSTNELNQKLILDSTSSGGVCINDTLCHLAVPDLPFGGVGESGTGAYHGKAGFDTFSHRKSVLKRSLRLDNPLRYPPYGDLQLKTAKLVL